MLFFFVDSWGKWLFACKLQKKNPKETKKQKKIHKHLSFIKSDSYHTNFCTDIVSPLAEIPIGRALVGEIYLCGPECK